MDFSSSLTETVAIFKYTNWEKDKKNNASIIEVFITRQLFPYVVQYKKNSRNFFVFYFCLNQRCVTSKKLTHAVLLTFAITDKNWNLHLASQEGTSLINRCCYLKHFHQFRQNLSRQYKVMAIFKDRNFIAQFSEEAYSINVLQLLGIHCGFKMCHFCQICFNIEDENVYIFYPITAIFLQWWHPGQ